MASQQDCLKECRYNTTSLFASGGDNFNWKIMTHSRFSDRLKNEGTNEWMCE